MLRNLPTKTLSADPQLAAARAHFAETGAALCNAAGLIDGAAGTARVLRLMADLREATYLNRGIRRWLVDLHRLLSLDPVFDGVEQICISADRLFDLLVEIGERDERQAALAMMEPASRQA
jgi:hypothetical protein